MSKNYSDIGISADKISNLKQQLEYICKNHLNKAEEDWDISGAHSLVESKTVGMDSISFEDSQSLIPGHENVSPFKPTVDDFIAVVCDIRNSSQRVGTVIKVLKVNGIQRVFYETSALLPVIEATLESFGGKVTEYLGDGLLGFIKYEGDKQVYDVYHFSKCCLTLSLDIVNEELKTRYNLPALQIGIGLAFSKALVRVVTNNHVKAFGECVWKATKLSDGCNKVYIDDNLKAKWPKSNGGSLNFSKTNHSTVNGYRLYPQS